LERSYIYSGAQPIAFYEGDYTDPSYFYLHDRLGSVRQVLDTSANVVNTYTYTPFGQDPNSQFAETVDNPFMFTGQWFDSEIGQYHLRARMYDPQLMRFTARDTFFGEVRESLTLHKSLYCANDPINYMDISGRFMSGVRLVNNFLRRPYLQHQGKTYEALVSAGGPTSLEALADMADSTAWWAMRVNDRGQFVDDMLWLFTERRGPRLWETHDNLDLDFGQTGFKSIYQDGGDQVRHFVGFLGCGYYLGGDAALWFNELRPGGTFTWADIFLGYRGLELGNRILLGLNMENVGDWIRENLGE